MPASREKEDGQFKRRASTITLTRGKMTHRLVSET
jgi:hypothetical protein